jgi:hypothetical protein
VRGELVDRLAVVAAEQAVGRDVDLPLDALCGEGLGESGVEVVPVDGQRGLPALDRRRGDLDRVEVAGVLDLHEEVDAGPDVVEAAAVGQRRRPHPAEGRGGLRRVAVERDEALVLRVEQLLEAGRALLDRRRVAADRDVAAVVVVPAAVGVLLVLGDVVPGLDLVRRQQVLRGGLLGEGGAEVEHVRAAVLPLLALDGVQLVLAGAVGVRAVDLDAVLLAEGVEHLAVVRPVRGQRDDVERALLLGRLDQRIHAAEVLGRRRGGRVDRATAGSSGAARAAGAAVVRAARGESEGGGGDRERGPQGVASHGCPPVVAPRGTSRTLGRIRSIGPRIVTDARPDGPIPSHERDRPVPRGTGVGEQPLSGR